MTIDMHDDHITSVAQLAKLNNAVGALGVEDVTRKDSTKEIYAWMSGLLTRLRYHSLTKKEKGTVRRYLTHCSGYTESHIDHLIARFRTKKKLVPAVRTQPTFPTK